MLAGLVLGGRVQYLLIVRLSYQTVHLYFPVISLRAFNLLILSCIQPIAANRSLMQPVK